MTELQSMSEAENQDLRNITDVRNNSETQMMGI